MSNKITLTQLKTRIRDIDTPDEEIAAYLLSASDAFAPQVRINPELVDDEGAKADVTMRFFNAMSKRRRQKRYFQKIERGWDGLRIVSQGDSWFQYPFLMSDVIDQLFDDYAIYSLGADGDLVQDMLDQDEILQAVRQQNPHVFLISGGGDDLFGNGMLKTALHPFKAGKPAKDYPNATFGNRLRDVICIYRSIFERLLSEFPSLKILCHGYDYFRPSNGPWLGKPMAALGIEDKTLQAQIVAEMIDRFNTALVDLAGEFPGSVVRVSCLDCVRGNWHDELHPNNAGYAYVADNFRAVIASMVGSTTQFESTAQLSPSKEAMDKDKNEFDPTNLESLLVARPLLEMMALLKEQQANPKAVPAGERLKDALPVVIDMNMRFSGGRALAKSNVIELIEKHKRSSRSAADEVILRRKTRLSPQYIFAKLTPETIRFLAAHVQHGGTQEQPEKPFKDREIFMIWPDFDLDAHMHRTVATIKADAARKSFSAEGNGIVWAVVDSGISSDHWHFKRHQNLDLSDVDAALRHMDFTKDWADVDDLPESDRERALKAETAEALADRFGHGSHVAGIIAGEYLTDPENGWAGPGPIPKRGVAFKNEAFVYHKRRTENDEPSYSQTRQARLSGMAPHTKLVSFKVLDDEGRGEVSNIIAALAQIQEINEHGRHLRIHGINLSVGYPFNPEWFACGQSPLCVEVDRLVKSGVVVVVSAGNSGYGTKQTLMTKKMRAGMLMTINDPGNARLAITVGSTHSEKAHEFGPSYFSSKGPTGDGRLKPDLLAPGERIISCGAGAGTRDQGRPQDRNRLYIDQSGTSMAAPHVSGAIAAFLSIRREFIGQPEKVKEIFVNAATDLGRDRNMQGSGLLDLMRAIQSV